MAHKELPHRQGRFVIERISGGIIEQGLIVGLYLKGMIKASLATTIMAAVALILVILIKLILVILLAKCFGVTLLVFLLVTCILLHPMGRRIQVVLVVFRWLFRLFAIYGLVIGVAGTMTLWKILWMLSPYFVKVATGSRSIRVNFWGSVIRASNMAASIYLFFVPIWCFSAIIRVFIYFSGLVVSRVFFVISYRSTVIPRLAYILQSFLALPLLIFHLFQLIL